jgi:Ca2+-binding RTX toxin-like protein
LLGGRGNDQLSSNDGNDRLYGGLSDGLRRRPATDCSAIPEISWKAALAVTPHGGRGHDFLSGGEGKDHLHGGQGDTCS